MIFSLHLGPPNVLIIMPGGIRQNTWLVGNALGGGRACEMAIALQKEGRGGLVPWAGVAARLPSAQHPVVVDGHGPSEAGEDENVLSAANIKGQAFCFLPLPCQTGQPVLQCSDG